jgi:hypothetical protein
VSDDIHEPEPADDDIPVLTDIVVPGRLRAEVAPVPQSAPPEFVFDIDFERAEAPGALPEDRAASPVDVPAPGSSASGEAPSDFDLPLPWADAEPAAAPALRPTDAEPLITAALAKAAAVPVEPPDPDAQLLLRELLAEVGNGLERRLAQELADTEQRLRAALREELDTRLRELLAGVPHKT